MNLKTNFFFVWLLFLEIFKPRLQCVTFYLLVYNARRLVVQVNATWIDWKYPNLPRAITCIHTWTWKTYTMYHTQRLKYMCQSVDILLHRYVLISCNVLLSGKSQSNLYCWQIQWSTIVLLVNVSFHNMSSIIITLSSQILPLMLFQHLW